MKPDQRQSARKLLYVNGILTIDGTLLEVKTIDISLGGISIKSLRQLTGGKDCHVKFGFPVDGEMHIVVASAHVVYCFHTGNGEFKAGLQFRALYSDGSAAAIAKYIEI